MTKIYVLHDSPQWVAPLAEAFKAVDIPFEFWYLNEGLVPLDSAPPQGVFYNRIGASAHSRGNAVAPELARLVLSWLEDHGRRVINDSKALALELSKLAQYQALARHGIKTPRTSAAVGKQAVVQAAQTLDRFPLILKPNKGGKGLGVYLQHSLDEVIAFTESEAFHDSVDGVWLVQDYIQAPEPFIIRSEFVGGRFLYAMRVNTEEGFQLCPAEVCSLRDRLMEKFKLTHDYDQHPVIARLEAFLAGSGIEVAGIEFVLDAQGELYVYDVNTNTNYNTMAEEAAGIVQGGMAAVSRFLHTVLQQHASPLKGLALAG